MALSTATRVGPTMRSDPLVISDLRGMMPTEATSVTTMGAFTYGDGGFGHWVYLLGNQSSLITNYPELFIAPTADPSGLSGCWALNTGSRVDAVSYGLGLGSKSHNNKVLKQINIWNAGKRKVLLPATTIALDSITLNYNPNWEGIFGATANAIGGAGTCFMFDEGDLGDCITFTPASGRITGFHMHNVTFIGKDFFDNGNISVFAQRTRRVCLTLQKIGGQVDIRNIFCIGFQQAYRFDEVWDGSVYGMRALYCGAPDGSVPAMWMGSTFTDNTNALRVYGLHLEFCPYSLYVGLVRNVNFYGPKFESQRQEDATHWGVNISIGALECNMNDPMFVTTHTTLQPFVLNQGIRCRITGAHFISRTPDATSKYPGVVWYLGNRSSQDTSNILDGAKFTWPNVSDGTTVYPIQLGNYEQASNLRVSLAPTVTTQGGTSSILNSGLVSMGYGTVLNGLSVNANSNTKTAGPLIRFDGTGASASGVSATEGTGVYSWASGNKNNRMQTNYSAAGISDKAVPDVIGKDLAILTGTSALSVTGFNAMQGQVFSVLLGSGAITLVHSSSLILKGGANVVMQSGVLYRFQCVNTSGNCIQI